MGTVCNLRRFAEAGISEDQRGREYLRSHKSEAHQVISPRLVRFAMTVDSTTLHSALIWSDVSGDGARFKYRILSDNNSRRSILNQAALVGPINGPLNIV